MLDFFVEEHFSNIFKGSEDDLCGQDIKSKETCPKHAHCKRHKKQGLSKGSQGS